MLLESVSCLLGSKANDQPPDGKVGVHLVDLDASSRLLMAGIQGIAVRRTGRKRRTAAAP